MSIQPLNNSSPLTYPPPTANRLATEETAAAKQAVAPTSVVEHSAQEAEKTKLEESKESLRQATQKVNQLIDGLSSDLKFTVDEATGSNVVKVIDSRTKEVIRQIPAQEMLEIAKRLDELRGLLIKEQV